MKDYGFIEPTIDATHYVLGGSTKLTTDSKDALQPDGQWDAFLPIYEPQAENFETYGCTVWGTQNCIETLYRRCFGVEPNYSERFTYILAAIRPKGSDPHHVAEVIRHEGLVNADVLPVTETYEEFIEPDPMPGSLLARGQNWLVHHSFMHDWVIEGPTAPGEQMRRIKHALSFSPVGISVTAWHEVDGVYVDDGAPNNHWCMCYGWTGRGWKVFDSYDHSHKIIAFDHRISFAKRYHLGFEPAPEVWWLDLSYGLARFIRDIIKYFHDKR